MSYIPEPVRQTILRALQDYQGKGRDEAIAWLREYPVGGLLPREQEIVTLVAQGMTNREIAECLVISERTARTHVSHALLKLHLVNRTQLAVWAIRHGVVDLAQLIFREE